jgi:ABC-type antimicrobial peptide transport system permease subunit
VSFAGTAALLAAVAVVACVLPARRASALNPITALRRD